MKRRRILSAVGLALVGTVAGCSEDAGNASPTDAVETYFTALADGDHETANQVAHVDGDFYIDDDTPNQFTEAENLTITETETVEIERAVESMFQHSDDVQIEERVRDEEAAVEEIRDDYGFADFEYVRHDASADGLSFNSIYLLFESDDGWTLWSLPTAHM